MNLIYNCSSDNAKPRVFPYEGSHHLAACFVCHPMFPVVRAPHAVFTAFNRLPRNILLLRNKFQFQFQIIFASPWLFFQHSRYSLQNSQLASCKKKAF